jgi:hypothetical protein
MKKIKNKQQQHTKKKGVALTVSPNENAEVRGVNVKEDALLLSAARGKERGYRTITFV